MQYATAFDPKYRRERGREKHRLDRRKRDQASPKRELVFIKPFAVPFCFSVDQRHRDDCVKQSTDVIFTNDESMQKARIGVRVDVLPEKYHVCKRRLTYTNKLTSSFESRKNIWPQVLEPPRKTEQQCFRQRHHREKQGKIGSLIKAVVRRR